ncbi:MAG: hypothetical protein PHO67_07745 [Candidatus Omnitrophica bacterium]|nr:hypothetical protein [Candidatus Omnitrophota bacterium]
MKITDLKSQVWTQYTTKIRPGDIGAVVDTGIVARLSSRMILPSTDFLHFFLFAEYVPGENDFVILESIPSHGVAVARASWYLDKTVAVFRPSREHVLLAGVLPNKATGTHLSPEQLGREAVWQATKWGRSRYDYRICVEIGYRAITGCLRNWIQGKGFTVHFTEFPLSRDKSLLCTQLVDEAYYELYPVFDRCYEVLPANFMSQYADGYLDYICGWPEK